MPGVPSYGKRLVWLLALCGAVGLIVAARHAPPIREVSDGAILEIYTLQALKGTLLVGPYSRFGWHHPGPLYFYLEAPWYWLSGRVTAGMQAGALAINLVAIASAIWMAARLAAASQAMAISIVIAWYVLRTGDMLASDWNPHVIILPTVAFIVVAAALGATGRRSLLLWLVAIGSFLVQTHVGMVPVAVVLSATVAVARRHVLETSWRVVAAIALILWLPPLVEQLTHHPGNFTRIAAFFVTQHSDGQSLAVAIGAWSAALTSVFRPDFRVAVGIDVRPPDSVWPLALAGIQMIALALAVRWARGRRDRFATWLASLSLLASGVALLATMRIGGQIVDHEIFWMSAVGAMNVAIIAGIAVDAAADALGRTRVASSPLSLLVHGTVLIVVVVVGVTDMSHVLHRSRTVDDHAVDVLTDQIQREIADTHVRRPLFRIEQAVWPIAAGALLQMAKTRQRFAVDDRSMMFGSAFEANGREDAVLTITGSTLMPILRTDTMTSPR